jgi:retron-type reverse transcriptase
MKRAGHLFERVCSWENLERAARRARKRKRYRLYAEAFELRRESILREIRDEMMSGSWQPRPYETFLIHDPKERRICAPCYRDRVVHHALVNVVGPLLERRWIDHTYSCRIGKGTGAARERCRWFVAHRRYVLQMDVRRYFPSIDHAILKGKLRRQIKCMPTLRLLDRVIDSWRDTQAAPGWFAGDELFSPAERTCGLPIGALTSQLLANEYLSRIDHLIQEQVRPDGYIRYTDDLLLFDNDKRKLADAKDLLVIELARDRLRPHPTKCCVRACCEGIGFLGFRFFPNRVRVKRENRQRFERRIRQMRREVLADRRHLTKVWPSMFGWFQFIREFPVNEGLVQSECRIHAF